MMRWIKMRPGSLPKPELLPNRWREDPEALPSLREVPVLCVLRAKHGGPPSYQILALHYLPNAELREAQHQLALWIRGHEEAGTRNEDVDWSTAPKVDWAAYHRPESYVPHRWVGSGSSWHEAKYEEYALNDVLYWTGITVPPELERKLATTTTDAEKGT